MQFIMLNNTYLMSKKKQKKCKNNDFFAFFAVFLWFFSLFVLKSERK